MIAGKEGLMAPGTDDFARAGDALYSISSSLLEVVNLGRHLHDFSASNVLSPEQVREGLTAMILALGGLAPPIGTLNEVLSTLKAFHTCPLGARSLNS